MPDRHSARTALLTLLAFVTVGLVAPAFASAATYTVNSIGDQPDADPGVGGCVSTVANCTLRAAIQESNASTSVDDTILFSPLFNGSTLGTIVIGGGFPPIADAVTIDGDAGGPGGKCATGAGVDGPCVGVDGAPGIDVASVGVVIEGLAITGAETAIDVNSGADGFEAIGNWVGLELDGDPKPTLFTNIAVAGDEATLSGNLVEGGGAFGITFSGPASGGLIEGNTLRKTSNNSIQLSGSSNQVLGNVIEDNGFSSIFLTNAATGNQIGGDTPASENVLEGSMFSPIAMVVGETTFNEVARNRGSENGGPFISIGKYVSADPNFPNGGITPPSVSSSLQSSAAGIGAAANAKVRVFRKATEEGGEIAGFLGEATADGSGNWVVKYSGQVPIGTNVAVTQTNTSGGTSELAFAVASADPPPPCTTNCGGGSVITPPPTPPDTTKPKLTIKKAPKAKSTSTTAKFKFTSDEAGSSFQCKLDKGKFKKCASPKTYKKLKPGKHTFKVKATDQAGNVSAVVTRLFTVLE